MVYKKDTNKLMKTLKYYQTWQLIIFLILFSFIVAILLRLNNTGMVSRREAVLAADEQGNHELTKARLADLQSYVINHMNASTGPFSLEAQYKRDSEAAIERAKAQASNNPNGNVYKKASDVCDPQFRVRNQAYIRCFLNELEKYPTAQYGETEINLPNVNLYKKEFIAPDWSLDWAGMSIVVWIVIASTIVVRTISRLILMLILRKYKSVV